MEGVYAHSLSITLLFACWGQYSVKHNLAYSFFDWMWQWDPTEQWLQEVFSSKERNGGWLSTRDDWTIWNCWQSGHHWRKQLGSVHMLMMFMHWCLENSWLACWSRNNSLCLDSGLSNVLCTHQLRWKYGSADRILCSKPKTCSSLLKLEAWLLNWTDLETCGGRSESS